MHWNFRLISGLLLFSSTLTAVEGATDETRKNEAKRLYQEYNDRKQMLPNPFTGRDELAPLIDGARSLDPDNPDYRRESILNRVAGARSPALGPQERMQRLCDFAAAVREFYTLYPDYRKNGGGNLLDSESLDNLNDNDFTDEQRAEWTALLRELRPLALAELKAHEYYRDMDLHAAPATILELDRRLLWLRDSSRWYLYGDCRAYLEDNYRRQREALGLIRDFLRDHPEAGNGFCWEPVFPALIGLDDTPGSRTTAINTLAEILNRDNDWDEVVREINLPEISFYRRRLSAVRDFLNQDRSETALKAVMFAQFVQDDREHIPPPGERPGRYHCMMWEVLLLIDPRLSFGLENLPSEYRAARDGAESGNFEAEWLRMRETQGNYRLDQLQRWMPEFRATAYRSLWDFDTGAIWARTGDGLYRHGKKDPDSARVLAELNAGWTISTIALPGECVAATSDAKQLFVAITPSDNGLLEIYEYTEEAEILRRLPYPGLRLPELLLASKQPLLYADAGKLILAGNGVAAIFDRAQKRWTLLRDLPGAPIRGVACDGKRLYYLSGRSGRQSGYGCPPCGLYSCNLDGSEARGHFATDRRPAKEELDTMTDIGVDGPVLLPDGRLLFGVGGVKVPLRIYCFDPATEQFSIVHEFQGVMSFSLEAQGDRIAGSAAWSVCNNPRQYFQIDPKTLQLDWVAVTPPEEAGSGTQWLLKEPLHFTGNWLLGGGDMPRAIRLDAPERTPLLLLPGPALYVTEFGSDWYFVFPDRISRVAPHPDGVK